MVTRAIVVLVALAACQGGGGGSSSGGGSSAASGSAPEAGAGFGSQVVDAPAPEPDAPPRVDDPETAVPDPGKQIAELGAMPAWQAVIDRAQLLGRRNQHGVVYGRIGPAILVLGPTPEPAVDGGVAIDAGMVASPYVWLVDDTEGNGALGVRVALGSLAAKEGDRVALGGAWMLDEAKRWYWKADAIQPLAPAAPSDLKDPPAPAPSHEVAMGNGPYGGKFISYAKDHDAVYFQLVGPPPVRDGDGWPVANELGDAPFALMTLPGERASYGGQDMRGSDERWQLKRGQTYWVRIGKIRPPRNPGPNQPVYVTARTAPVRVN